MLIFHSSYLESTLSWDAAKVDAQLLPLIKRQNDRKAVRHFRDVA